jgi:4-amino-4-deoxy-L-arabinose transferase-like glycosyltransferase
MKTQARDVLDRLPQTRRPRLWLALLCLALWLPGFFTIPPGDRDESRFAQATRQMLDTGDYVRIKFGDVERNKKPAGIHWAQAATVKLVEAAGLGDRTQIWPYRLPGLIGALIAVLATFQFGRQLVGRRAAFLGAAMLASCTVLVVETHIAKTDAALLATIAIAMGLFSRAYLSPGQFTAQQAAGFWGALGVGVLLKGPIAPMVPLLAGITLLVADRRTTEGRRIAWLRALRAHWGVVLMLAVSLPWFIAITLATEGRFLQEAIGGDMLSKLGSGEEQHWGPPGYYLLSLGLTAFPAAWILLRAVPDAWSQRMQPATRVLLAWAVPTWLVFEAVATKLPHYVLPAFPPLMLLAASWALDPLRRDPPRWLAWLSTAALVAVAGGLGIAAAALPKLADGAFSVPGLLALPVAALLIWLTLREARAGAWARAALLSVLLALPLQALVMEGVLPRLTAPWVGPRLAAAVQQAAPGLPEENFGIVGYHEPSMVFAMGAGTRLLGDGPAAARFLAEGPGRVVAVGDRQEAAFREEAAAKGLTLRELGIVTGFNYSRGRRLTLSLFRVEG